MSVIRERYRVLDELSETSYGWVFECLDTQSVHADPRDRLVVVKRLSLELNARMWASPAREQLPDNPQVERDVAQTLRRLGGHPNIVQYLDEFVEFDTLYYVMEHCADGDLHSYVSDSDKGSLSCIDAMSVLSQVASGIAFLHLHGIAHRDVSLENVFMHQGRCKLGDFGLATRNQVERGGQHLRVGKKYYMAPEIVDGEHHYSPKAADVWSLGIMLFIMLTGSPLVTLASQNARGFRAFKKVGVRQVIDSWGLGPVVWESVVDLLDGMLQVNPAKRLTMEQVLEHKAFADWVSALS